MSDMPTDPSEEAGDEAKIALEFELDAPPEKVWRAITIADFRERWLPLADLAEPEPVASIPGVEVQYRMREDGASFADSLVTFRIEPGRNGGALLRIVHRIESGARLTSVNDNVRPISLAA
jgi:carbon monoxide dehydrogenase subunit G